MNRDAIPPWPQHGDTAQLPTFGESTGISTERGQGTGSTLKKHNREKTSDLHPDKVSVNDGVKTKSQEVVLEEPEVKLQLWAQDAVH